MELEGLEREQGFRATLSAGMISRKQPKRDVSGQFVLQQQGSPKSRVLKTMDFFFASSSLTANAGGQGDVVFQK